MRARPNRAVSLLVTSAVLTGLLIPGAAAQASRTGRAGDPPAAAGVPDGTGAGAGAGLADLPAEPPAQPRRSPAGELFGADCDIDIQGSYVTAYCHNPYPETDRVSLHVECDRWWDVDGDRAPVALHPAGRVELAARCWKEVRSAWVGHGRG
ncbi:hypothetical protein [Streptomyces sp. NPDC012888]|uniref:hypothetical protein n=1 Tax=Streptomyces sp. NPDC012888 TaxID=3364855 RepID=UPI0036B9BBBF